MSEFHGSQLIEHADGSFELSWQITPPQPVTVWQAVEPDGHFEKLVTTEKTSYSLVHSTHHERKHFKLQSQSGAEQMLIQRRFKLDGAPNFRDFGGYSSQFGGAVKWGSFFRSGRLSALSEADYELLHALNIHTIYDLRQDREVEHNPTVLPNGSSMRLRHLPIVPGNHQGLIKKILTEPLTREDAQQAMLEVFNLFVTDQTQHFKRVVEHLLHHEEPLLVHCSAGKDRTGATAAFILMILGVSRDDIMRDYMLTERYYPSDDEFSHIEESMGFRIDSNHSAMPLMSVATENLHELFAAIDSNFDDEQAFFEQAFGIDADMRHQLVERWVS